jgi:hypothetical protein
MVRLRAAPWPLVQNDLTTKGKGEKQDEKEKERLRRGRTQFPWVD